MRVAITSVRIKKAKILIIWKPQNYLKEIVFVYFFKIQELFMVRRDGPGHLFRISIGRIITQQTSST